jgi:hypothetical protein
MMAKSDLLLLRSRLELFYERSAVNSSGERWRIRLVGLREASEVQIAEAI